MPVQMDRINPKGVDGVLYASQFSGVDIGAKINAAIAALPVAGGVIEISAGTYPFTTGIVITKPIILRGQGIGAASNLITTVAEPTTLQWNATSGDAISINLPGGGFFHGASLECFTIIGNKNVGGATTGSGVAINGGNSSTQLAHLSIKEIDVRDCKEHGFKALDNVFIVKLDHCMSVGNVLDGFFVGQTGLLGAPSQFRFFDCYAQSNGRDGYRLDTGTISADFFGCTGANNVNGLNARAGVIDVYGGDWEANSADGIVNSGGAGGAIVSANCPLNVNGIHLSNTQSFTIIFANASGNSNKDLLLDAAAKDSLILASHAFSTFTDNGTRTVWMPQPGNREVIFSNILGVGDPNNANSRFQIAAPGVTIARHGIAVPADPAGLVTLFYNTVQTSAGFAVKDGNTGTQPLLMTNSGVTVGTGLITTVAAPSTAAGQVGFGSTVASTVGAAGGASALPATPLGYLIVNVAGTQVKVPYYNN